jgi:SAM-dependent methyltransferase
MRDHNREFCRLAAEMLDCPGPVYEFGSFQVEGQEGYANLRDMFPGRTYVGCDMRPGLGVDRVEDVTDINLADQSVGTVLCIETFEHVFEVRRAFDEVFRILEPGGVFVITSPLNFRIHAYPDDYWRMTPNCLRRMLSPYAARLTGYQGYSSFPHSVMGIAIKSPAPIESGAQLQALTARYDAWLCEAKSALSPAARIRRAVSTIYRSKGERRQIREYFSAGWNIDFDELMASEAVNHSRADLTASF